MFFIFFICSSQWEGGLPPEAANSGATTPGTVLPSPQKNARLGMGPVCDAGFGYARFYLVFPVS